MGLPAPAAWHYGKAGQINHADLSLADEAILQGDTIRAVQLAKRTLRRGDLSCAA